MAKRYIGDAVVNIAYRDRGDYAGTVSAGGHRWRFEDLRAPAAGLPYAYDSPAAYDRMAQSAVSFGSNYDSEYEDPPREVASAIEDATAWAQREDGTYVVTRSPGGPARALEANPAGSAVPWVVGGLLAAGLVYLVTRPAKAATKPATGLLPPPPAPLPGTTACTPTPDLLAAFGNANGIEIYENSPIGYDKLTAGPLNPNKPQLAWTPGENVLRTTNGQIDQAGTQAFCAYAAGQAPLACSFSGPGNFTKFSNWAFSAYHTQAIHVVEWEYPPPPMSQLQKSLEEGGITYVTALPGEIVTDANTLVVTRAPYEMVWRYYQGQPTQAPEIVAAYCQAVASGNVQGPRVAHPALAFMV